MRFITSSESARQACVRYIQEAGVALVVEINPASKPRTKKQNAAMYGVAEKFLADHCGYQGAFERKMLHVQLCCLYFGEKRNALGATVPIRTTTTNESGEYDPISTSVANDFYAFIQRIGAEHFGIDIPDPDPEKSSEFKDFSKRCSL